MNKTIKINQFEIPEQGKMIVRTRHSKEKFIKLLKNSKLNFLNGHYNNELDILNY
jgi:hypothetical protein